MNIAADLFMINSSAMLFPQKMEAKVTKPQKQKQSSKGVL